MKDKPTKVARLLTIETLLSLDEIDVTASLEYGEILHKCILPPEGEPMEIAE